MQFLKKKSVEYGTISYTDVGQPVGRADWSDLTLHGYFQEEPFLLGASQN